MTLETGLVGPRRNPAKCGPTEGVPVKVFGYCRSSRWPKNLRRAPAERVAEAPLGVESQRAAIVERFPDATIYVDNARSGRDARRPGLQAMLAALEPGGVVAVTRLDRLARDLRLAMALELQIEATAGCRLFSLAGEGTRLDGPPDPVQVFQRRMMQAAAELQAAQAAQATAAAFAVRRARGLTASGHAPYGYLVGADGRIEPHPVEQAVLEHVQRFTRGRLWNVNGQEVADQLNRAGFTNRAGRPWNRTTARKLAERLAQRGKVAAKVAS